MATTGHHCYDVRRSHVGQVARVGLGCRLGQRHYARTGIDGRDPIDFTVASGLEAGSAKNVNGIANGKVGSVGGSGHSARCGPPRLWVSRTAQLHRSYVGLVNAGWKEARHLPPIQVVLVTVATWQRICRRLP
jgi:hypothetical protein